MSDIIKYIIIGIVQGISEVLPISSSAHLAIVENLLMIDSENLTLEVFLHLASLVAVVFYLRKRLWSLITGFFKYSFLEKEEYKQEFKICWYLVFSTIPIVVFTILFKEYIYKVSNNLLFISSLLIVNGITLLITTNFKGKRKLRDFNLKDALTIGLFQCLGVFPGISRSGSCLYGGYTRKIEKEDAVNYAFLLFFPAVIGSVVLEIENFSTILQSEKIGVYLVAFVITTIVTYLSFKFLMRIIKKDKVKYFGYYCIVIGVISLFTRLIK